MYFWMPEWHFFECTQEGNKADQSYMSYSLSFCVCLYLCKFLMVRKNQTSISFLYIHNSSHHHAPFHHIPFLWSHFYCPSSLVPHRWPQVAPACTHPCSSLFHSLCNRGPLHSRDRVTGCCRSPAQLRQQRGVTEDEVVGWHHWLTGCEFKQTPGAGEGQESLVCFSLWGLKESDTTEWLNRHNKLS